MVTFQIKECECTVDDCDADLLASNWELVNSSSKKHRNSKYIRRRRWEHNRVVEQIYLHRAIMARVMGRKLEKQEQVDHIDMNGLNNCRSNLRIATKAENMRNTGKSKRNTSGFKGVSKNGKHGYMAKITQGDKQIYLGTFKTPEAASEAYIAAAKKLFGEFANGG
jgi:hypothetical protein